MTIKENEMLTKEMRKNLKNQLYSTINSIRVPHSISVASTAMEICKRNSLKLDVDSLYKACLFHDVAKELPLSEMLLITANAIRSENETLLNVIGFIEDEEMSNPIFLHGLVGAIIAYDLVDLTHEESLKAIRYHKIAKLEDDIYTKILFVADNANDLRTNLNMRESYKVLLNSNYNIDDTMDHILYWMKPSYEKNNVVVPFRFRMTDEE
jgi:HD superfamily phosphohydrolase YqeK